MNQKKASSRRIPIYRDAPGIVYDPGTDTFDELSGDGGLTLRTFEDT
jgi:hypothetical protein